VLLAVSLLMLAACASTRVSTHDLAAAFDADFRRLRLRVVSKRDLDPARAANARGAMLSTARKAEQYIARSRGTRANRDYAKALLACALLAQGKSALAAEQMREVKVWQEDLLSEENRVTRAVQFAVDACRGVAARAALEEMFAGELGVEEFIVEFGSFLAIQLPPPDEPVRAELLADAAERLRGACFPVPEGGALEETRVERGRTELRRLAGELIYNEAAALFEVLPRSGASPSIAVEHWLASVALNLCVVYAYLMPDLLPVRLTEDQKEWQREHAIPVYENARRLNRTFLSGDTWKEIAPEANPRETASREEFFRHMYARLLDSQIVVVGWISTR
jgi:hypothetical protein